MSPKRTSSLVVVAVSRQPLRRSSVRALPCSAPHFIEGTPEAAVARGRVCSTISGSLLSGVSTEESMR